MRTKTLLLTAAALAAGLATSVAQSNVYSVNVVGYVNITLTNGFNLIGNQLDLDGTGLNNNVNTVFGTNLPNGSVVYAWGGTSFASPSALYGSKTGWSGGTNAVNTALAPGKGVFVALPAGQNKTITLVGNVMQGSLSNSYASGYSILASTVPQAGQVQTDLGFVPVNGATVYKYNPATQAYVAPAFLFGSKTGWSPSQPSLGVGEAMFLASPSASAWVRTFTVGP